MVFTAPDGSTLDAQAAAETLRNMPIELREVIVARIWGGLSFEEIAQATGTSTTTAFRRCQDAITELRERMGVTWLMKDASPS